MNILIIITIIFTLTITNTLTIHKTIVDNKTRRNSFEKTILKISVFVFNTILAIIIGIALAEYIIDMDYEKNNYFLNNNSSYPLFISIIPLSLSIAFTKMLMKTKERNTLYLKNNFEGVSNNLCDYCAFEKLDIEKNTFEEDEIINLIKEQPEKIELVKKILK